ncbi:histidine kinase N-terminal domain-containing protein [Longispora sp. K20-0274]|uniref:sensor histidine kinase n=1 Tax=Longispora sp. K20-0274 TaxID=3088255 RepID=UPI00399ACD2E
MSTLRDLVEEHTDLDPADIDHLHRLAGDWQLLSDLSFADLLMWVPVEHGEFRCVAQVRPTTAPTAYLDDQVGHVLGGPDVAHLAVALEEGRIWREGDPVWYGDTPARREAIPVRTPDGDRVIALLGRDTNLSTARTPSQLELNYLTTADDLTQMVADGTFPPEHRPGETTSAPRVGDGLIRLDADGKVVYASPNAQSAYRRLGFPSHLTGEDLAALTGRLADDPLEGGEAVERIFAALRGESPARKELDGRGATLLLRALPLLPGGHPIGAVVLCRDITEVRRRDRALVTKDATIREIHHRVKNNLQTVAALLRLQARRVDSPQAKLALEESVRRVASIALVHETLSMASDETVEFDTIVDRVASMAAEVSVAESRVTLRREGTFGVLSAEIATPLVMVLNELLQNAVEHAYGPAEQGEVVISAHRWRRQLHVTVSDSGQGLPADFDLDASKRLGLQIVRTLVTGELRGTIELRNRVDSGMEAVVVVPLSRR